MNTEPDNNSLRVNPEKYSDAYHKIERAEYLLHEVIKELKECIKQNNHGNSERKVS